MMPANNEPTPAIYNGNMDITPTPAPGVGGGSDQ